MKKNKNENKKKKPVFLETYISVLKPAPKDSRPSLRIKWFTKPGQKNEESERKGTC